MARPPIFRLWVQSLGQTHLLVQLITGSALEDALPMLLDAQVGSYTKNRTVTYFTRTDRMGIMFRTTFAMIEILE